MNLNNPSFRKHDRMRCVHEETEAICAFCSNEAEVVGFKKAIDLLTENTESGIKHYGVYWAKWLSRNNPHRLVRK